MGSDEDWEAAENGLKTALAELGMDYELNEGDGAFYGPKIDFHLEDSLGRTWQCGTVQLDFQMPLNFGLEFVDHDGSKKRPLMLHRVRIRHRGVSRACARACGADGTAVARQLSAR